MFINTDNKAYIHHQSLKQRLKNKDSQIDNLSSRINKLEQVVNRLLASNN